MARCQKQKHQENADSYGCEHVEKLFFQQISCAPNMTRLQYSVLLSLCGMWYWHACVYEKKYIWYTCTVDALFHART